MAMMGGESGRRGRGAATFDLNLAPMLDMMVVIIPFLLLSAVFMQMMIIDVPLPQVVAKALEEDRNKKDREVVVAVVLKKDFSMDLNFTAAGGKTNKLHLAADAKGFNTKDLHRKLVEFKQQYPKLFRLELSPEDGVNYNGIVSVMDASRMTTKDDPKILIEDAETNLLYPDVVLANLMGN